MTYYQIGRKRLSMIRSGRRLNMLSIISIRDPKVQLLSGLIDTITMILVRDNKVVPMIISTNSSIPIKNSNKSKKGGKAGLIKKRRNNTKGATVSITMQSISTRTNIIIMKSNNKKSSKDSRLNSEDKKRNKRLRKRSKNIHTQMIIQCKHFYIHFLDSVHLLILFLEQLCPGKSFQRWLMLEAGIIVAKGMCIMDPQVKDRYFKNGPILICLILTITSHLHFMGKCTIRSMIH